MRMLKTVGPFDVGKTYDITDSIAARMVKDGESVPCKDQSEPSIPNKSLKPEQIKKKGGL